MYLKFMCCDQFNGLLQTFGDFGRVEHMSKM